MSQLNITSTSLGNSHSGAGIIIRRENRGQSLWSSKVHIPRAEPRSLSLGPVPSPSVSLSAVRHPLEQGNRTKHGNKKLSRHNGGEDVIALSVGGLTKGTRLYVTISISPLDPRATCRPLRVLSNASTGEIEGPPAGRGAGSSPRRWLEWPLADQPHCRLCFEVTKQKMRSIRDRHCSQLAE